MGTLATQSPADLLGDYLVARSAISAGWTLFIGKMPANPDKVVALMDTGGVGGIPNLLVDTVTVQVLVRGGKANNSYNDAYQQARLIREHLIGMANSPAEFTELDGVTERGYLMAIGSDDSNRAIFSNNFQLILEPLPNGVTHRISL